jgi:curved DNA-binding protein
MEGKTECAGGDSKWNQVKLKGKDFLFIKVNLRFYYHLRNKIPISLSEKEKELFTELSTLRAL